MDHVGGPADIPRVTEIPQPHAEHPKTAHLSRAEHHFQRAIQLSGSLCEDTLLVRPSAEIATAGAVALIDLNGAVTPTVWPSVGDYLEAMGCADYVAKSYLGLGRIYLEQQAWDRAETCLATATDFGLGVQDEWLLLGAAFETTDRHLDAARVYLTAIGKGHAVLRPIRHAFRNLAEACR